MNEINMKANIFHVARYIVEKLSSVTTMKLQKLVYYAQAWSLAWDGKPLFEEDFQAWANGPVSQALYEKHRGKFVVDEHFLKEYGNHSFTDEERETIDAVIRGYGERSAMELSFSTHQERPWLEARKGVQDGEPSSEIILKETMQDFYAGIE